MTAQLRAPKDESDEGCSTSAERSGGRMSRTVRFSTTGSRVSPSATPLEASAHATAERSGDAVLDSA